MKTVVSSAADMERSAARFSAELNASNHFAWIRTRLAAERTLMSYNRTAIALIGFGFTLYQFLAKLNADKTVAAAKHLNAPQWLGLQLIGSGLILLIIGLVNYRALVNYLYTSHFETIAPLRRQWHSGAQLTAALIFIAGEFAFVSVLLRV